MKINFMPTTLLGKWSISLAIALTALFVLFQVLVALGERGGETFFSNLMLTIPIILAGISGVLAFLTGILGIIRSRERSILVFLSTMIGFFVLLFILGEILFPH